MVAEKGKKSKPADKVEDDGSDHIDVELVQCIEKLQEVQDELEKVTSFLLSPSLHCCFRTCMTIGSSLCMHFPGTTVN